MVAEDLLDFQQIDAGFEGAFNAPGGAYDSVQFQNANHSVRVTDEFMHAYEKGGDWETRTQGPEKDMWLRWIDREVPLKRFGQPEEIACAVTFALSPVASFLTGAARRSVSAACAGFCHSVFLTKAAVGVL